MRKKHTAAGRHRAACRHRKEAFFHLSYKENPAGKAFAGGTEADRRPYPRKHLCVLRNVPIERMKRAKALLFAQTDRGTAADAVCAGGRSLPPLPKANLGAAYAQKRKKLIAAAGAASADSSSQGSPFAPRSRPFGRHPSRRDTAPPVLSFRKNG